MLMVWAAFTTPPELHYTDLLYYWQDNNSYLAKLRQGVRGEWLYTVPFVAEPGEGVFLYPNYLLLGHIARWFSLEPVIVFHAARLFGGAMLLLSLYALVSRFFTVVQDRRLAFLIAAAGSGFGWFVLLFDQQLVPDILQAEIYPYLSALANPHFPLAMAAYLWLLDGLVDRADGIAPPKHIWKKIVLSSTALALLQPYGLVNAGFIGGAWLLTRWTRERHFPRDVFMRLLVMALIGLPYMLYTVWAVRTNAALAAWDAQNITRPTALWKYMVSGGYVLPFAFIGGWLSLRRAHTPNNFLLVWWALVTILLVFIPAYLNLYPQSRRFAFGLFIPLALLAWQGLLSLPRINLPLVRAGFVFLTMPTNILLVFISLVALARHSPTLFFTQGEWQALLYLRGQAPQRALVLASPDFGLYVPAWAGQRVIYGHPHETGNAKARANEVVNFYAGTLPNADEFLRPVDYIVIGPREMFLGPARVPSEFAPVFTQHNATLVTICPPDWLRELSCKAMRDEVTIYARR